MSHTSKLDEVVANLEKEIHLNRIKKVMICACRGKWENNQSYVSHCSTKDLVQELYWKTQTPENLYNILDLILSKINKKSEYALIVSTIITQVGQLYIEDQANAVHPPPNDPAWNDPSQTVDNTDPSLEFNSLSILPYLSEVRWKVMQYTNPLRVKLLLFSTLEEEFDFKNPDWSQLKIYSLEDLLRQLLQHFPSFTALKTTLIKIANYLENPDENFQSVSIILDSIQAIHTRLEKYEQCSKGSQENSDSIPSTPPNQATESSSDSATELSNSPDKNPRLTAPKNNYNSSTFLNEKLALTQSNLISTRLKTEELAHLNTQLESQINLIVQKSIKKTIYPINQTWDELQNHLDLYFKNLQPQERFDLKKQALQELLNVISLKVNELQQSLNQLESTEIQSWQSGDLSQQNIMQLARKGNPQAIATLINQSLKSKDIRTQVKSQNGCLHIVLVAEKIPDAESIASFIHKKLIFLKIESIQTLKIYARKTEQKKIAWTQEYPYNSL